MEEKKVAKLRLWEVTDLVQECGDIKIPSQVCVQIHQQWGLLCFWILCAWSLLLMFISVYSTPRRCYCSSQWERIVRRAESLAWGQPLRANVRVQLWQFGWSLACSPSSKMPLPFSLWFYSKAIIFLAMVSRCFLRKYTINKIGFKKYFW